MQQNPRASTGSHRPGIRGFTSILTAVVLALGWFGLASSSAAAAEVGGGAEITFGYGPTAKALKKNKVKITSIAPGTHSASSGGRVGVELPVTSISEATFDLGGGLRFSRGGRSTSATNLSLTPSTRSSTITGLIGARELAIFTVSSSPFSDSEQVAVTVPFGRLTLTAQAARLIQSRLGADRIAGGTVGGMSALVTLPFEDPYLDACAIGAATRTFSQVPVAAEAPDLVGPSVLEINNAATWGVKASLNGYVNAFSRPVGLGGTTVNPYPGPPNPASPPKDYSFVSAPGTYAANNPSTGYDDQAVVNSTGGVMYCNTAHGFRITISEPTVVIDGSASRIIANVDTNLSANPLSGVGDWMPSQRVNLARLDLTGLPAVETAPGSVRWAAIPAKLTQEGSDALRLCEVNVPGAPPNCLYPAGTALDAITVTITYPVG